MVTGFVRSDLTGERIPAMIVRLAEVFRNEAGDAAFVLDGAQSPGTLTDVEGRFIFQNVEPREYVLIVGNVEANEYEVIAASPDISMDDGCDLVCTLHEKHPDKLSQMLGGSEETTTGVIRLRAMEEHGALGYPVIAVNDANTKHFFDNRYGTCLLYTSPSPRDRTRSRMPSSA